MKSEVKIRKEYAFISAVAFQVYRLKNKDLPDERSNREVIANCETQDQAEMVKWREEGEQNEGGCGAEW